MCVDKWNIAEDVFILQCRRVSPAHHSCLFLMRGVFSAPFSNAASVLLSCADSSRAFMLSLAVTENGIQNSVPPWCHANCKSKLQTIILGLSRHRIHCFLTVWFDAISFKGIP